MGSEGIIVSRYNVLEDLERKTERISNISAKSKTLILEKLECARSLKFCISIHNLHENIDEFSFIYFLERNLFGNFPKHIRIDQLAKRVNYMQMQKNHMTANLFSIKLPISMSG